MAANRVIVLENGEVFVCISGCCLFSCRENGKKHSRIFWFVWRDSLLVWFRDLFGIVMKFCRFEVRILLIHSGYPSDSMRWSFKSQFKNSQNFSPKEVHFLRIKNKNIAQLHINPSEFTIYTQKQSWCCCCLPSFPFYTDITSLFSKTHRKFHHLWRKVFMLFLFFFCDDDDDENDTMWSINIQYKWLT